MKKEPAIKLRLDQFTNLTDKIDELIAKKEHVVVAVSGFGGAGKTSLAEELENFYKPNATQVKLDDFLRNHGEDYGWDYFEGVLKEIKLGNKIHYQPYDWHKNMLSDHFVDLELTRLIIIEGVRILQPEFTNYYDLMVWIDVDLDTATFRGKKRDEQNWEDESDLESLYKHLDKWHAIWSPKDREYFEKFHPDKIADFIYKNS